ncbi:hypothetical protein C5F49_06470 [Nitrosopumilus oxyclinae]|uniref:Uncharacterized protein n=1 Tax=Nitrosopumilus oxyclinae TaxID=1959104 RepID=A0A7D5R141_9ARCH|nr:hypothetical protein [Nitrosopumilus oxyclinae]QLH05000.1 hypothetical protein C5F49_06470 [Nitrosopumilus oxyclinae]
MQKKILFFTLTILIGVSTSFTYAQEMNLATFQESAQVVVDRSISQNVTASITLQSTSIQEIKIPTELEQSIRDDDRITAVIFTNQNQCVLGVVDQSCIMINVQRNMEDRGIIAIQDSTKMIAEKYIGEINQIFDTNAEFHSVFVHTDDKTNQALETSGAISGKGTISAVYTLPMEDTNSMYEKVSAILIPKIIRDAGGFYDVAKKMSSDENAKMTFSMIPLDSKSLLQLRLSVMYPNTASTISEMSPLEFLQIEEIKRSDYFSTGFYPLNSIIQVVILSPESISISDIKGNIVPTQIIDNEKIPTDIKKQGWIFDPQEGEVIQGKYIFGEKTSIKKDELKFSLVGDDIENKKVENKNIELDESIVVVVIITIVAIAAALFYLKGYKK